MADITQEEFTTYKDKTDQRLTDLEQLCDTLRRQQATYSGRTTEAVGNMVGSRIDVLPPIKVGDPEPIKA